MKKINFKMQTKYIKLHFLYGTQMTERNREEKRIEQSYGRSMNYEDIKHMRIWFIYVAGSGRVHASCNKE